MPALPRLLPLLGALLILAIGTACTRGPVYRLSSTVPDASADWLQGRTYVTRTADSVTATVASAGSDVADGVDSQEENEREAIEHAQREAARANDRVRYRRRTEDLQTSRIHWSEDTFRKTTLPPRTGVRGYVYLPVVPDARYVLIHVGLFEESIVFPYRQEKH